MSRETPKSCAQNTNAVYIRLAALEEVKIALLSKKEFKQEKEKERKTGGKTKLPSSKRKKRGQQEVKSSLYIYIYIKITHDLRFNFASAQKKKREKKTVWRFYDAAITTEERKKKSRYARMHRYMHTEESVL